MRPTLHTLVNPLAAASGTPALCVLKLSKIIL